MDLYFNNAVDSNWTSLGNWWTNLGCTTPAGALPGSGDHVTLKASCMGNGAEPTIAALTLAAVTLLETIDLHVTGTVTLGNSAALDACNVWAATFELSGYGCGVGSGGALYGPCNFSGEYAYFYGYIEGDCNFSGEHSYGEFGTIFGNVILSGPYTSLVEIPVTGTVTVTHPTAYVDLAPSYGAAVIFQHPASVQLSMTTATDGVGLWQFPFADVLGSGLL